MRTIISNLDALLNVSFILVLTAHWTTVGHTAANLAEGVHECIGGLSPTDMSA